MKICFVASTYPRTATDGSGRFVLSIAEAVAQQGHEVHVLAPHHPEVEPFPGVVKAHHFRYIWPDRLAIMGYAQAMRSDKRLRLLAYLLAPLFMLAEAAALWRLTARERFDVIHAHWVVPNGPAAALVARLTGASLYVSLHGSDIFIAGGTRALHPVVRRVFAQARGVTACSPELADRAVMLGANPAVLRLIPWGADAEQFAAPCADAGHLRARWGLRPGQPVILSVGRLVRKKGLRYLVRALPLVVEHLPDVRCVIAGDGPERAELERLARDLDVQEHVIFTGSVEWTDVPCYQSISTLFVVPSVRDEGGNVDGLPTTILEAMAAGNPVVASDVAGISLAVRHGVTGLLVDEKDVRQLADALLLVLANPHLRQRMGAAGRVRVERELNWRRVGEILVEMYGATTTRLPAGEIELETL